MIDILCWRFLRRSGCFLHPLGPLSFVRPFLQNTILIKQTVPSTPQTLYQAGAIHAFCQTVSQLGVGIAHLTAQFARSLSRIRRYSMVVRCSSHWGIAVRVRRSYALLQSVTRAAFLALARTSSGSHHLISVAATPKVTGSTANDLQCHLMQMPQLQVCSLWRGGSSCWSKQSVRWPSSYCQAIQG